MNDNNRWIWSLVQGLLAIGIGLWALLGRDSALGALIYATAIYVALAGLIQTARALLNWKAGDSKTELVRGLIGLIGGALVLALAYFTTTAAGTVLIILAVVLIAYGVVGLFSTAFARGGRPFEWQPVVVSALMVALGALIFIDQSQEVDLFLWTAVIFLIVGIAMVLYALMRQRGHKDATAAI